MIDSKRMGRFIVEKRKALGLTQTQLSEKLNVSFQAISKWENGVAIPKYLSKATSTGYKIEAKRNIS